MNAWQTRRQVCVVGFLEVADLVWTVFDCFRITKQTSATLNSAPLRGFDDTYKRVRQTLQCDSEQDRQAGAGKGSKLLETFVRRGGHFWLRILLCGGMRKWLEPGTMSGWSLFEPRRCKDFGTR